MSDWHEAPSITRKNTFSSSTLSVILGFSCSLASALHSGGTDCQLPSGSLVAIKNWQKVDYSVNILNINMPHRHKDGGDHHRHRNSNHGAKKPLKASSMATRHKSADSKKLLTKTYSEIGVSSNAGNAAETPTPSEKVSKWHRDILLVSPPTSQHHAVSSPIPKFLSRRNMQRLECLFWFLKCPHFGCFSKGFDTIFRSKAHTLASVFVTNVWPNTEPTEYTISS